MNFIKSLRMGGKVWVVGTDTNKYHLEWPDADARYVVPLCTSAEYIEKLNEVIAKEGAEFVHPQPDVEVRALSEQRERVHAKLLLPAKETIRLCQDKIAFNKRMAQMGVPVPRSLSLSETSIAEAFKELPGPVLWMRTSRGMGSRGALPVRTPQQAEMWARYWEEMKGVKTADFMLAELLPGKEFAFQSVWKDGEIVTSQARERMEYVFAGMMPSGQSSSPVLARTVSRDDVNDVATRAVLAADPKATGVFCVDMKENARGVPCVTEINAGRFFTTSNFFSAAGANMPWLYLQMAYGEALPKLPKYNPIESGVYWIRNIDCDAKLVRGERWRSKDA